MRHQRNAVFSGKPELPTNFRDGPNKYFKNVDDIVAGVLISPPMDGVKSGMLSQTRISLIVDGNVIDLNRIRLPANTPIEDARFRTAR